jgi:hypothetical protein
MEILINSTKLQLTTSVYQRHCKVKTQATNRQNFIMNAQNKKIHSPEYILKFLQTNRKRTVWCGGGRFSSIFFGSLVRSENKTDRDKSI